MEFLLPLHRELTPRQQTLRRKRMDVLAASHNGKKPNYLPASEATTTDWAIPLPDWCADQRNQMTGPADDAELVVKMLNSGAPGVMLDLEDSMANTWSNLTTGLANIDAALKGELTYFDAKRQTSVGIKETNTVTFTRPRGLHISQAGVLKDELMSASLFDVAMVAFQADVDRLRHPLSFYIPKSESAEEALWWRDLFQAIEDAKGWPRGYIKCMALVESHPIAYQMEEFIYNLRDHIIGLNLGRWDYMASLIHFNFEDPEWILPDRNTIPHNVPFFQNLRELLAETCHKHGILAIGGMTALYPSRTDHELNERALRVLAEDKKNEANCLMDGAWTGHPDQNEIAVQQFPFPNQVKARKPNATSTTRPAAHSEWRRKNHDYRNTGCDSHRDPLSQWRAERQGREPARRLYGRPRDRSDLSPDDRATHSASRAPRDGRGERSNPAHAGDDQPDVRSGARSHFEGAPAGRRCSYDREISSSAPHQRIAYSES